MKSILILLLSLLLLACQNNNEPKSNEDNKENEIIINVETTKSYQGQSIATFKSTAVLEADRQAVVTTKTSGIILDILVEEGDTVNKGDLLLVLESDAQELEIKSAAANYAKSLNNYERAQQLISKGLTNKEQLDNLKFETQALKSSLDKAKMNLSYTKIVAPFDGVVVKRLVKIGNLIQNATAVFEIVDFNSLQAKIDVPEHQWSIMKSGLPVIFNFDALQNMEVKGEVLRVSPIVDSSSGTFQITVSVVNSDYSLRPGLFAKASVVYDQRQDVVLIDKDAIIREDEISYVYVVNENTKIKKQAVELGYEMIDSYEIKSGLVSGLEVVTTGKNNLTPDATINVVNYEDSQ